MTETAYAYLAGVIDGDGSIQISEGNSGLQVTVRMMRREVPDWILSTFNLGTVGVLGNGTIQWRVAGIVAGQILTRLLPYLVLKKERALIGIAYAETISPNRSPLNDRTRLIRCQLMALMTDENAVKTEEHKILRVR